MQEESDAQYKGKGKKGSKAETTNKAEPASTSADSSTPEDSSKDVEMTDASVPSSSGDRKHVGEMTGQCQPPVLILGKYVQPPSMFSQAGFGTNMGLQD